jgi:phosphoserine phosphatase
MNYHTFMTSLTPAQAQFVDSVLRLEPRVAVFDCDGTLWSVDAGERFFSWELEQELVSDEIAHWARLRYADYQAGKVDEEVMCGEMVTMHRGLREEVVQHAADSCFAEGVAPSIFGEMRELVRRLHEGGCEAWVVSSSNQWIIRSGMRYFEIPPDRILAGEAAVENGLILDRLVRMPSGPGKSEAIREVVAREPDCAFGNSIWDREMLEMSKYPFAINPNSNLKEIAISRNWRVYQPEPNHDRR